MTDFDVAIVGGGPAGAAAALALRGHAPHLRVVVLEASRYEAPRVGEILPAAARGPLTSLGAWAAFESGGFFPARAMTVAWESSRSSARHAMESPHGHGWHLDRARFDSLLAGLAEGRGAVVRARAKILSSRLMQGRWRLEGADGAAVDAGLVIWTCGRRSGFAAGLGATRRRADGLVAAWRIVSAGGDDSNGAVVEAVEDGWWYAVPLGGEKWSVALMTDADLAARRGIKHEAVWLDCFAETTLTRRSIGTISKIDHAAMLPAGGAKLDPTCGENWFAAGDAAMAVDPISGQGIARGLRSGIFAAYAAADTIAGDARARPRYERLMERDWIDYTMAHATIYAEARRFAGRAFWDRRFSAAATTFHA